MPTEGKREALEQRQKWNVVSCNSSHDNDFYFGVGPAPRREPEPTIKFFSLSLYFVVPPSRFHCQIFTGVTASLRQRFSATRLVCIGPGGWWNQRPSMAGNFLILERFYWLAASWCPEHPRWLRPVKTVTKKKLPAANGLMNALQPLSQWPQNRPPRSTTFRCVRNNNNNGQQQPICRTHMCCCCVCVHRLAANGKKPESSAESVRFARKEIVEKKNILFCWMNGVRWKVYLCSNGHFRRGNFVSITATPRSWCVTGSSAGGLSTNCNVVVQNFCRLKLMSGRFCWPLWRWHLSGGALLASRPESYLKRVFLGRRTRREKQRKTDENGWNQPKGKGVSQDPKETEGRLLVWAAIVEVGRCVTVSSLGRQSLRSLVTVYADTRVSIEAIISLLYQRFHQ